MSTNTAIVTGVRALWEHHHFQDLTIQVEDRSFKVHKLIMASVSDYFRAMLTGGMAESQKDTVQVGVVTAVAMETLINFIYKDKMELTQGNVVKVLDGAMYLQIPTAVEVCVDYIVANLNTKNCYSLLSVLQGYSLTDGVKNVRLYIKSNVRKIIKEYEPDLISIEELWFLIEVWKDSEYDLFVYLNKWVDADPENRKQHLNHLMDEVHYCLMTKEELGRLRRETNLTETFSGSRHLSRAFAYHGQPVQKRVCDAFPNQSVVRSLPTLLCVYDHDETPCCTVLDENKEWTKLDVSIPECSYSPVTTLEVNNFLIIAPRVGSEDGDWYVFDPRTLSWFDIAPMPTHKENFASVYHYNSHMEGFCNEDGYFYVIGGSDENDVVLDEIERYRFETNKWRRFTNLPDKRERHAACVLNHCIYISGGRHDTDGSDLAKVDCLNIATRQWESKAPMLEAHSKHSMWVMKLHGEEVISVLTEAFRLDYYIVSSDQWSTFAFTHYNLPQDTSGCGLIAKGNTVYFLDEHTEGVWNNKGQCLEITFPEEGTDVSVTSLKHFMQDISEVEFPLFIYGAFLSLPDHKLRALKDETP